MNLDIFDYLSISSEAIAGVLGLFIYRFLKRESRLIVVMLCIGTITSFIGAITGLRGINNLFLFHFFTLFEHIITITIIRGWVQVRKIRKALQFIMISFVIFWIISKFTFENIKAYDNYTASLNSTILIIACGYYLSRIFLDQDIPITKLPEFWFALGIFIYHSGVFVLFGTSNLVYFWDWHNRVVLLSRIILIIGLVVEWKK